MSVKVARCLEGQRLVYYRSEADAAFWDSHWKRHFLPDFYISAEQGTLSWFENPFTRYLPSQGLILEAGCGLGQYVLALQARGYNVEGVEWAPETVRAVQALYPDLPISVGDVTRLEVPDEYYQGYISLGVVEHRRAGPELFLKEAYRVLAVGGVAFFSVPHFHSLRRLKANLGFYKDEPKGLQFYQYAFTELEFAAILQAVGFTVIEKKGYGSFKGIKDEIPLIAQVAKWRGVGWRLKNIFEGWSLLEQKLGHMILFVCKKMS